MSINPQVKIRHVANMSIQQYSETAIAVIHNKFVGALNTVSKEAKKSKINKINRIIFSFYEINNG